MEVVVSSAMRAERRFAAVARVAVKCISVLIVNLTP